MTTSARKRLGLDGKEGVIGFESDGGLARSAAKPGSRTGVRCAQWRGCRMVFGGVLERALDDLVPRWVTQPWGFAAVEYFP